MARMTAITVARVAGTLTDNGDDVDNGGSDSVAIVENGNDVDVAMKVVAVTGMMMIMMLAIAMAVVVL